MLSKIQALWKDLWFNLCSYWPKIDDALREAAFKGLTIRLMGSYWNHTDSDMLHFMRSLSDDAGTGYHSVIETVSSAM